MTKRELIDTRTDKRYVRRDEKGRIAESDDVGPRLASDSRQDAGQKSVKGQGRQGRPVSAVLWLLRIALFRVLGRAAIPVLVALGIVGMVRDARRRDGTEPDPRVRSVTPRDSS